MCVGKYLNWLLPFDENIPTTYIIELLTSEGVRMGNTTAITISAAKHNSA